MSEYQDDAITGTVVGTVENPFARALPAHVSAGAVAIESERAVAEAQGKLVLAKRFPRDTMIAASKILDACKRPSLAKGAIYSFSRGGNVTGPSIRLAEEMARCWGNIEYGLRELSQKEGFSEMEAFAWDLETNVRSSQAFTVRHIRDRRTDRGGSAALTDQRDIYEITANMGARRLRARILAVLPADLVNAAVEQVRLTMRDGSDLPLADRIREAVAAFEKVKVTPLMLVAKLGHPLDVTTPDELVDLEGIYNSIYDGQSKAADHFGGEPSTEAPKGSKLDALEQASAEDASPPPPKRSKAQEAADGIVADFEKVGDVVAFDEVCGRRQEQMVWLADKRPDLADRVARAQASARDRIGVGEAEAA